MAEGVDRRHPERAALDCGQDPECGGTFGRGVFESGIFGFQDQVPKRNMGGCCQRGNELQFAARVLLEFDDFLHGGTGWCLWLVFESDPSGAES